MIPLTAAIDFGLVFGLGIPIGAGFAIAMTAILTGHSRQMQRDDMEATLKMEMIQRGMAAEEIERVLAARMGGRRSRYDYKYNCNQTSAEQSRGWRRREEAPTPQR